MAINDPRIPQNRALVPAGPVQRAPGMRVTDADARVLRANANRPAPAIRDVGIRPRPAPGTALVPAGPRQVTGQVLSEPDARVVRANRTAPRVTEVPRPTPNPRGPGVPGLRYAGALGGIAEFNRIKEAAEQGGGAAAASETVAAGGRLGTARLAMEAASRLPIPHPLARGAVTAAAGLGGYALGDAGIEAMRNAPPSYSNLGIGAGEISRLATARPPAPGVGRLPGQTVRPSPAGGGIASPRMIPAMRGAADAVAGAIRAGMGAAQSPAATAAGTEAVSPGTDGGATSIAGRPLGYGEMRDGVRVFSDGSGTGIPRTMSDEQIAGLGARVNTVPAANFARPAPGVAASMATGGQTPALGSLPRRPEAPMFSQQFDPVRAAQMDAAADLEAAYSGDMRSPLGRAARNASVRGLDDTYLQTVRGSAEAGIAGRANLAQERIRDAGATQRTGMDVAGRLTEAGMIADAGMAQTLAARRPTIAQVPLEDGTLGLLDAETGQVRVATGADGMPARPALTRQQGPNINSGIARLIEAQLPMILGVDPASGMRPDRTTPTPQEIAQATEALMIQFGAVGGEGSGAEPSFDQWLAAARQSNPGMSDEQLMQKWRDRTGS